MSRFNHQAVLAPTSVTTTLRPERGPIALMPEKAVRPEWVKAVKSAGGEVAPLGADTRAILWVANSDPAGLIAALESSPQVQWVQLPWAGVDAFAEAIRDHARDDLLWTSAKGAYSQPVAEHALALLLACLRQLGTRARATSWGEGSGESLYGRRVVIVGAGGIAHELIRLLQPFDVEVTVVRRSAGEVDGAHLTVTSDHLDEVLPDADAVVIAAASTSGTRHMIGAKQVALLKPSAVLVNIARGALIDTDALVEALREGRLLGAGVDVTDPEPLPDDHPLWREPRALITPHTADTIDMTAPLLAERIRHNVTAFTGGGAFVGVVDAEAGY
jgi:phosphoglycerate dehydrogenase-like enzyme